MQSLITWYGSEQANKNKGKGQNRNAKSVAKEEGGKGIATRIEQPPRKRRNSGNPAFNRKPAIRSVGQNPKKRINKTRRFN